MSLRVLRGGRPGRMLLLLHGLGATADVWDGLASILVQRWPGHWAAPDLPGHGGSAPLPAYTFGAIAAAVAGVIDPVDDVVVLGHSLGGVVGLALAGARPEVVATVGVGIKVAWSDGELARAAALAAREPAWFDSQDEAAARYLRVSGLGGLIGAAAPAVTAGVVEVGNRWRLALDDRAFGVGRPPMAELLAAAGRVILARGEHDAMVSSAQLRSVDPTATELRGLGHNAHVEAPEAMWRLIEPLARVGKL